jgi:transposase-like protein
MAMYRYQDSNVYAADEAVCPKCGSRELKDNGGCAEGCCDDYVCKSCGYAFRIEWPD